MELEALRTDLITVINHYGKAIPVGPLYYVLKDVLNEVQDAYNEWLKKQNEQNEQNEPSVQAPETPAPEVEE